ncbi:MAG: terminase small subunit [Bacteroidales bacterium]|jgi:phage terminase small subunit
MTKLTDKQKRFVKEYVVDLNATQAAIRAGYSKKTARQIANQNLSKAYISAEIQKEFDKIAKQNEVSVKWVIDGFVEVANRCMQRMPVMEFDKESKQYIQVMDEDGLGLWSFNSAGANKALEMLGRHLGMFNDKLDVNMTINSWDDLEKELSDKPVKGKQ